jgi:hypothetical protein
MRETHETISINRASSETVLSHGKWEAWRHHCTTGEEISGEKTKTKKIFFLDFY